MKLFYFLLMVMVLAVFSCSSNKELMEEDIENIEDFEINSIYYKAANYLNLSQERKDVYFDILIDTERRISTINELITTPKERTQALKDLREERELALQELFSKEEYISYRKFLKSQNNPVIPQMEPRKVNTNIN